MWRKMTRGAGRFHGAVGLTSESGFQELLDVDTLRGGTAPASGEQRDARARFRNLVVELDPDVVETEERERTQQVRPFEPAAGVVRPAEEPSVAESRLVVLPVKRVMEIPHSFGMRLIEAQGG